MGTERRRGWSWLKSPAAIKAHLVCLFMNSVLSWELLSGNNGPHGDYLLGLAFFCACYPFLLFLVWLRWRTNDECDS